MASGMMEGVSQVIKVFMNWPCTEEDQALSASACRVVEAVFIAREGKGGEVMCL